jgi:hypothetical protein
VQIGEARGTFTRQLQLLWQAELDFVIVQHVVEVVRVAQLKHEPDLPLSGGLAGSGKLDGRAQEVDDVGVSALRDLDGDPELQEHLAKPANTSN